VPHVLESAPTGRARCRGCSQPIARAELRLGERIPNPFGDGEATLWFHLPCAACKRPEPLLEALEAAAEPVPERAALERSARLTLAHRRLRRIDGAEPAPSARARCRHCGEPIGRGLWRIRLVYLEEGRFTPGGNVHLACAAAYFETDEAQAGELLERLLRFSPDLSAEQRVDLERSCRSPSDGAGS